MISTRLAQELKDAGFKQSGKGLVVGHGIIRGGKQQSLYYPTLDELISNCVEVKIAKARMIWLASSPLIKDVTKGRTQDDAVAKLWLLLQK